MYIRNFKKHSSIAALLLGLIIMSGGSSALAELVVIVHPDSGVTTLSASNVKKLFLRKSKMLAGSTIAVPVDQKEGSESRAIFRDKVLKKSEGKLKAYWSKLVFSGKGSPPKIKDDDAAVKSFVAGKVGAIGYIDSSLVDSTVLVVLNVK